ncbi:MAG TPA: hypothetical protein VKB96_08200 [Gammaproteobacteria bacterium]|nr:hypothetical protein [Gammaproteobacteria bacterium]
MISIRGYAERQAYALNGLHRSVAVRARPVNDSGLRQCQRYLAGRCRRYGYRRLHNLLRNEGRVANRKRT